MNKLFESIHIALIFSFLLTSCSYFKGEKTTQKTIGDFSQREEIVDSDVTDDEYVEIPIDIGEVVGEDTESTTSEEITAEIIAETEFPIVHNEYVQQWINYFTGKGKRHFVRYLERSTRYQDIIFKIIDKYKLPRELFYLAMIESGFNLKAVSWVGAKGPWQFMRHTGRAYGLDDGYWVDERRDLIKSTDAACRHLKDLHDRFNSWYLAAAAYNAGSGKVRRAIKRYGTRNFWSLRRTRRAFRPETRNYVPKMIAAIIIARDLEKYGITNVNYQPSLAYEEHEVTGGLSLKEIAKKINVDYDELSLLNSELRIGFTPPKKKYKLKIPLNKTDELIVALPSIKPTAGGTVVYHKVKRGDTLSRIARSYRSNVRSIMKVNGIKSTRRLRVGKRIAIPVNLKGVKYAKAKKPRRSRSSKKYSNGKHLVRRGETLWSISRKYKVSVNKLKSLNNFRSGKDLKYGHWIKVVKKSTNSSRKIAKSFKNKGYYVVKKGDSLWKIAQAHNTSVNSLIKNNNITNRRIYPGTKLSVPK